MEHTATPYSADALDMPASKRCPANTVLCDPRFRALVRKRRSFAWSLTGLMLAAYFAFILTLAFRPALLGQPIPPRGLNLNVPMGDALKKEFQNPTDSGDPAAYK